MGIQNSKALFGRRPCAARSVSPSIQRALPSRVNIHGLPGVHVPAGRVIIPTGTHKVADYFLMNPATRGLVKEWAMHDGNMPYVGFAIETAKSPYNPGLLHVVQRGADVCHMELLPEAEMIADGNLDAEQGHLELFGEPIDVLTYHLNAKGEPGDVMTGLIFFEQVALAAFLNRVTVDERAAAHLGALMLVSEPQLVHAANHPQLFEGSARLPGMPNYVGHWTRDFFDPGQLACPANERINSWRVWRGGDNHNGGSLPVADRRHSAHNDLCSRHGYNVARFAVLPAP